MKNRWNNGDAGALVKRYKAAGIPEPLALRVYSSRLIGAEPALVLHGGGNTSVKCRARDVLGQEVPVIYIKGSGWDLATIEPEGFPALRMEPIQALRSVKDISDEEMVSALRGALLNAGAPNPSLEAMLHVFLPHEFVDHSHADALLALVNQPDPETRCADIFGTRLAVVPFVFPGFGLARAAAMAYAENPEVEGIVLIRHGLVTFGGTARESYNRMIKFVTIAERGISKSGRKPFPARVRLHAPRQAELAELAPVIRGALAEGGESGGGFRRMILHYRSSRAIREFVDGKAVNRYSQRGVATPDHIIRTKNLPLLLPPVRPGNLDSFAATCREAVAAYCEAYHAYFATGAAASRVPRSELDPMPRVVLLPGAGFFAAGATEADALIAADIFEHTVHIIARAESIGRYTPLGPEALFPMEYWPLERAKLDGAQPGALAGQVALVTGAGSGIGAATALTFAEAGAHLVLLDREATPLDEVAASARAQGVGAEEVAADVTSAEAVDEAFRRTVKRFGGLDIVVSNAGGIWQGAMADVDEQALRESFELNFFSHQRLAAAAVKIFHRQGTGGH